MDKLEATGQIDVTLLISLVLATVVIPAANAFTQRCLFKPLGKYLLGIKGPKKTDDEDQHKLKNLIRFEESGWKCLAYGTISAISGFALHDKTFWYNTRDFWSECTSVPCEFKQVMPFEMRLAYACDMAYYTYAIPYALLYETKRKDMAAMVIHHIITVALIAYSYALGLTKVGVVIMFIHDICDVPLELAKMARYVHAEVITNIVFAFFTVLWITMRDYYFPFQVVRSVIWEAHEILIVKHSLPGWPHYPVFVALLGALAMLQLYWTAVILKILFKALKGDALNDARETDDDDDD